MTVVARVVVVVGEVVREVDAVVVVLVLWVVVVVVVLRVVVVVVVLRVVVVVAGPPQAGVLYVVDHVGVYKNDVVVPDCDTVTVLVKVYPLTHVLQVAGPTLAPTFGPNVGAGGEAAAPDQTVGPGM